LFEHKKRGWQGYLEKLIFLNFWNRDFEDNPRERKLARGNSPKR
jgi:hypothetical protein